MASLIDMKRELLMTWKLLDERRTELLWSVPRMDDSQVEAAHTELMGLADRLEQLDDQITDADGELD